MSKITVDLNGDGNITEMDEALLTPNHSVVDNENEHTEVKEFWYGGRIVHRSVHVALKQGVGIFGEAGKLGS